MDLTMIAKQLLPPQKMQNRTNANEHLNTLLRTTVNLCICQGENGSFLQGWAIT